MQKNFSKMLNISITALIMSFLLSGVRTLAMLFSFDFTSNFYSNDYLPYFLYTTFALFAVILYLLCHSICSDKIINAVKSTINKILEVIIAIIFLIFSMLFVQKALVLNDTSSYLDRITFSICVPTAFASGIFFIIKPFSTKNRLISVLALIPSIFFSSLLVQSFASVARTASSLSFFPDIISTLTLAFYLLNHAKASVLNDSDIQLKNIFTNQCITFICLCFSAIPDAIFLLADKIESVEFGNLFILFIKLIFIVYVAVEAVSLMKGIKDNLE